MSRMIDADTLQKALANMWYDSQISITGISVSKLIDEQPTIEPEPQWIPCSERLPEEEARSYWVCTDNGYQHECRWTNVNHFWTHLTTDWHWNIFDIPQYSKVIAWMPLPKPYKGG